MAESTFTLNFGDLRKEVSEFLYGGSGTASTAHKADVITRVIESGLRQFYSPPPLGQHMHDWSFLKPITSMTLQESYSTGTASYDSGTNQATPVSPADWSGLTWADKGMFEIDGINYPIETIETSGQYRITLDSSDKPSASIAATTYKIHQDDYDMPDDFGRVMGDITFAEKDKSWHTVKIVGENRIRAMRQKDYSTTSTVDPYYAAIKPNAQSDTDSIGSRQVIQFWPSISSAVVVSYRYRVRPSHDVTQTNKHPYGASDHSETILSACLAAAEQKLDNERGSHYTRFMACLAASIEVDSRTNRPENLGYNSDNSDGVSMFGGRMVSNDKVRHKDIDGTFID